MKWLWLICKVVSLCSSWLLKNSHGDWIMWGNDESYGKGGMWYK